MNDIASAKELYMVVVDEMAYKPFGKGR